MRVTAVLSAARSFGGRQWVGKDSKIWKYTSTRKCNTEKYFKRVAQNTLILANPYLTHEEETGSKQQRQQYFQQKQRS
eukprot:m.236708 g.236708  ORF g.236708 m.236708 type:complete len:78 (-) comp17103_c0_seq1:330-563(-)